MNPLTVTYSPILYTDIGFQNLRAWVNVEDLTTFYLLQMVD